MEAPTRHVNIAGGPSEAVFLKNVGLIFVDNRPASPLPF